MADTHLVASRKALLLNVAKRMGLTHDFILRRYAYERFLARLGASDVRKRFVLKGAMALVAVTGAFRRPTRDMDMLGLETMSMEETLEAIRTIARTDPTEPDGLAFEIDSFSAEPIKASTEQPGTCVTGHVRLGTTRIPFKVEVAFGDPIIPSPFLLDYPTVLDGVVPARVLCYSPESMLAEKLEAIVSLGITTTRYKDFWDVRELSRKLPFDGDVLKEAFGRTFGYRGTLVPETLPPTLQHPFVERGRGQWKAFLKRQGIADDQSFDEVVAEITPFVMGILPMVRGDLPVADWQPGAGWAPRGDYRPS